MKRKIKKFLSVPLIIYSIIFLSCLIMIIPDMLEDKAQTSGAFANIGYSLFASNIAGILFDLGNNISNIKKNQKQYKAITFSHSNLLNDLIAVVEDAYKNLNFSGSQDMTIYEQLKAILFEGENEADLSSKEYLEATEDISYWLDLLKKESEKLLDISYIMYENDIFNEKKRKHLRFLSAMSTEAIKQYNMHTIQSHKTVYVLISDRIMKQMLALYPEQKALFTDSA